ncbi:hypothetical protein BC829DRAFT_199904 [Chytridium lagenaria]|nr:hypothetical protein BC829DRAFT_199904 [Chytridium lagenaria]
MFCKLEFTDLENLLSPEENVKLHLISKYLDFKIGEVWDEIDHELYIEGIRPVTPDIECIFTAKSVTTEKSQIVQNKQKEILKKKAEDENNDQQAFFQRCFFEHRMGL